MIHNVLEASISRICTALHLTQLLSCFFLCPKMQTGGRSNRGSAQAQHTVLMRFVKCVKELVGIGHGCLQYCLQENYVYAVESINISSLLLWRVPTGQL